MLPEGAIFCGECGRAVSAAASRRTVAPEPADRGTPPPLQQPDAHGRRQDPAAEAWLPESTLDPATRAWLTGADRHDEHPPAVPVSTPDSFAPRTAPTHVHGSGSGLGEWSGRQDAPAAPGERAAAPHQPDQHGQPDQPGQHGQAGQHDQHDRPAAPNDRPAAPNDRPAPRYGVNEDDPEVTRVASRTRASAPAAAPAAGPAPAPVPDPVVDASGDRAAEPGTGSATPVWAPQEQQPPAAPSAPSWWIGRATDDRATAEPDEAPTHADAGTASGAADGARPEDHDDESSSGASTAAASADEATETVTNAGDHADEPSDDIAPSDGAAPSGDAARPGDEAPSDDAARSGDTAVVEPLVDRQPPRPTSLVQPGAHHPTTCHVCGHQLEPDDIFCNECGAVRPAVTAAFTGPVVPLPMLRPDWAARDLDPAVGDDSTPATDDEVAEPATDMGEPEGAPLAAPLPPLPDAAEDAAGPVAQEAPVESVEPAPLPDAVPTSATPVDEVEDAPASADDEDVDETRIVAKTPSRAPFVLHFSTGERLGLHGTALFGRLPRPEPGERFDDLLTIHDPGKSVSKTHLELGRDGDDLWVSDRFSGNGSVIRHIDGSIRRCEPGRRYRVERGARVDVGEQFFLVQ
ncbi:hypothetical protein [Curtobacterium sp. VKM Ac-1395]|uniref:hypothetical protein n=1 Tax=Curtobacterium sp. VKM Ac-1395 TaxID=2783815 RepID=UPI00188C511F|nr:hypothetical protein [Curtobacterium sp. VKM Ac-1395]MBF4589630.1 hypothetical protein [Curtobacterium sp. VKM Ac-1395]